ncbi:MAG: TIGR02680 family protein [Firmicutes bacterium]|nr:TIGR02680 family protein [Bacillota bacterium]
MTEKLQLNRAGLLNFWYYDNEIFEFSDGKLLLRGSNGSGKSVTMQSLIPVLLDGRKSPDRLDPFGSKARKMEDYLLGEPGVSTIEERTGYLWLEYLRPGSNRAITTGIGLRARRGSTMDFWGFVITDNRRIGLNFELHKQEYDPGEGKEVMVPLSRRELTNRLESGGAVVRGQREYMELVNRHVFGFQALDSFEDLIKLLIQLRSPKLSKDFKPTVIYEILNESIPPLADDELRSLTETIENMDHIRQQLEQLERDNKSLKKLCTAYDNYNNFLLAEKARGSLGASALKKRITEEKENQAQAIESQRQELEQTRHRHQRLKEEEEVLSAEHESLKEHDVFKAEEQRRDADNRRKQQIETRKQKDGELTKKVSREGQLEQILQRKQAEQDEIEGKIADLLDNLDETGEETAFAAHAELAGDYRRRNQDYHFGIWKQEVADHSNRLSKLIQAARELTHAQQRHQQADREHADASRRLDDKLREQKKMDGQLDAAKEQYIENFHRWSSATTELEITGAEKQLVTQRLVDMFEVHQAESVYQPVVSARERRQATFAEALGNVAANLKRKQAEIEEKEQEIQDWKNQADPEPSRHPDTQLAREKLEAESIPWLPFYAAVEFKQAVSEEKRERLEAAITQAGLLDALIVPAEHLSALKGSDKVIIPNPRLMEHTLADLLEPVSGNGVETETIADVLASILVDTSQLDAGQITIDSQGNYRIALISGQAPREKSSRYIGREARRRYRQQVIAELTDQLAALKRDHFALTKEKDALHQREAVLWEEYSAMPSLDALKTICSDMLKLREQLQVRREDAEEKQNRLDEAHKHLLSVRRQLQTLAVELNLPQSEEAYTRAHSQFQDYARWLNELELNHNNLHHTIELIASRQQELDTLREDVDALRGELNVIDSTIRKLDMEIEQVDQRLKEMGADDIRRRIRELSDRLEQLPGEIDQCYKKTVHLDRDIQDGAKNLETLTARLAVASEIEQCWQQLLAQELRITDRSEQDPEAAAKEINKELGHLLQQTDRDKVYIRLNQTYFQEQQILIEYRPLMSIHELGAELPEVGDQQDWASPYLSALKQVRSRYNVVLEYGGRHTTARAVMEQMEKDIEIQQQLLSEKDRELYEEIILHSVGDIIRKRISRAEQWVKKINDLMEQRDTSSGLTFSLRWKPRSAEQEDELDTKELVELLRKDPNILKEQDMQDISRHFRVKIERAKAELSERERGDTFHSIVRELLDYRQWFAFQLFYRRENEQKRELTDRVFFTFSGGEKAMAMYIPLFSAAYSRYQEARPDAPHIISLDEAFAGVDETNIRDMFDLVEQLGFNYIINSQNLWGDYDTANNLAIAELVRPKNAPWVTVIRYHWDGQVRSLKTESSEAAVTKDN